MRAVLLFLALLPPAMAGAQPPAPADQAPTPIPPEVERRQVVPFLPGTYVFFNLPRDHIKFEADIQPNFVIRQTFSDKLVIEDLLTGEFKRGYSIVGTPRVRLRMIDARSAPVRTPSYMPKGTFTQLFFRGEPIERGSRVGLWAAQATVGHHSNGQDGCLFTTDTLVGDRCVGPPDLQQINHIDGTFSTNFVRFGGRYRREWLHDVSTDAQKQAGIEEQIGAREFTLGFDIDRHFHTDPRVEPFYGTTRASVLAGGATRFRRVCKSRVDASVALFYVGEQPDTVGSFAFQAEMSCTFTDQGGWGMFARYYTGQDYYNLGFAESINRLMFGAHFQQDGFLRFVSRRAKEEADLMKRRREAR
jgi:hypothetical protein